MEKHHHTYYISQHTRCDHLNVTDPIAEYFYFSDQKKSKTKHQVVEY